MHLLDEGVDLLLGRWLQVDGVLSHLEWNTGTFGQLNITGQLASEVLEIVRFGTRVLWTELVHEHD